MRNLIDDVDANVDDLYKVTKNFRQEFKQGFQSFFQEKSNFADLYEAVEFYIINRADSLDMIAHQKSVLSI